jgi:archaellum biogenesis ATPase FlaH
MSLDSLITKQGIEKIKTTDYPVNYLKDVNDIWYKKLINEIELLAIHYESIKYRSETDKKVLNLLTMFVDYIEAQSIIFDKITIDNQYHHDNFMAQVYDNNVQQKQLIEKINILIKSK